MASVAIGLLVFIVVVGIDILVRRVVMTRHVALIGPVVMMIHVAMMHIVVPIVAVNAAGDRQERCKAERRRRGCFDKSDPFHFALPFAFEESFGPPSVQFPGATFCARRN